MLTDLQKSRKVENEEEEEEEEEEEDKGTAANV